MQPQLDFPPLTKLEHLRPVLSHALMYELDGRLPEGTDERWCIFCGSAYRASWAAEESVSQMIWAETAWRR